MNLFLLIVGSHVLSLPDSRMENVALREETFILEPALISCLKFVSRHKFPFQLWKSLKPGIWLCSSPHNVTQDRPPHLTDYYYCHGDINSLFVQKYYNSTFTKSEESFTLLGRDFKYPFLFDDMLFIMGIFEDLKSIFVFKNFKLFRRIIVDYSCHTKWEVDNGYVLCLLEPGRTFKFNGNQFEKL